MAQPEVEKIFQKDAFDANYIIPFVPADICSADSWNSFLTLSLVPPSSGDPWSDWT
jgi:hypothetical protein